MPGGLYVLELWQFSYLDLSACVRLVVQASNAPIVLQEFNSSYNQMDIPTNRLAHRTSHLRHQNKHFNHDNNLTASRHFFSVNPRVVYILNGFYPSMIKAEIGKQQNSKN